MRLATVPARLPNLVPGLLVVAAVAAVAILIAELVLPSSPLIWSVLIALACGHAVRRAGTTRAGISFSASVLLKAGIALLGIQVSLAQIASLGAATVAVPVLAMAAGLVGTVTIGRMLAVDRELTTLIAAGTSICGASAIAATATALRIRDEAAGYAIAVVTLYGSVAMLALPLAVSGLGMDPELGGIWAGASIHEVGQVAVAGAAISAPALHAATLVKLVRVACLAPVLLALRRGDGTPGLGAAAPILPGFLVIFVGLVGVRSLLPPSQALLDAAQLISLGLLTCGLAAIGLRIELRSLRSYGPRPLILGLLSTLLICGVALLAVTLLAG